VRIRGVSLAGKKSKAWGRGSDREGQLAVIDTSKADRDTGAVGDHYSGFFKYGASQGRIGVSKKTL